ncbi:MAG: response regulator, partial [Cyanobacteria bacterium]|nr:response regulator [Cyanobacteriota bacterium]
HLFNDTDHPRSSEEVLVSPLPLKSGNILPKPLLENTLLGFVLGKFNHTQQSALTEQTVNTFSTSNSPNFSLKQPTPIEEEPTRTIQEVVTPPETLKSKVLIIEDNLINQKVFYYNLIRNGFAADTAVNGIEALKLFDKNTYSLILMDIEMPEMDGYETSKHIRQKEAQYSRKRTPILAISARALKGENEACLMAGMDYYLCKPVQNDDLISMVNKIVNQNEDFIG